MQIKTKPIDTKTDKYFNNVLVRLGKVLNMNPGIVPSGKDQFLFENGEFIDTATGFISKDDDNKIKEYFDSQYSFYKEYCY